MSSLFSASPSSPSKTEHEPRPADVAAVQEILTEAGSTPAPAAPAVAPDSVEPAPQTGPQFHDVGLCGTFEISQDTVRKWIDVPFDAIAAGTKHQELKLNDFERAMFTPAVTGCLNRYLPDFLKNTDSPELAMLLVALTVYGVRIGAGPLIVKILDRNKAKPGDSSAPVTATAGSPGSTPTSDKPAPGKRFDPVPIFDE